MNRPPVSSPGVGLRVLVVDDDPRVRAAMTAELTAVGWQPTALGPEWLPDHQHDSNTGPHADPHHDDDQDLHRGDLASEFDVALVDVALPTVTDGLALITRLVRQLPVVAFSINGAARTAALGAGAARYLEKDGDTDRLLHALRTATTPTRPAPPHQHQPSTGPQTPRNQRNSR